MPKPRPYRQFTHPDGREWDIRLNGSTVELRIVTDDGEVLERQRKFDVPVLAARDLDDAVREQVRDGFVEHTPPDWTRRLDELVSYWEEDDPGFDAEVLRSQLLASGESVAKETIEKLVWWETGQPRDPNEARVWLRDRIDTTLPGVVLALRYADAQVLAHVDALLAEVKRPEILEGLLSIIENPTPEPRGDSDDRPAHMPLSALLALGKPDSETAARLITALGHADGRSRDVAAAVLAEFSEDDGFFAALWSHRVAARKSDNMCWAMLRAAEVRRAAELREFLMWMLKSRRFRTPGYEDRLRNALAKLKNR